MFSMLVCTFGLKNGGLEQTFLGVCTEKVTPHY